MKNEVRNPERLNGHARRPHAHFGGKSDHVALRRVDPRPQHAIAVHAGIFDGFARRSPRPFAASGLENKGVDFMHARRGPDQSEPAMFAQQKPVFRSGNRRAVVKVALRPADPYERSHIR